MPTLLVGIPLGEHLYIQNTVQRDVQLSKILVEVEESVSGGILQPGVVVGATDAGVEMEGLSRKLLGRQLTPVGDRTVWSAGRLTLFLPGSEVSGLFNGLGVLDPLDDLGHRDKEDLVAALMPWFSITSSTQ